jgi:Na+-transporting NADH:ubiquinone oxidoreductase subunit NqrF
MFELKVFNHNEENSFQIDSNQSVWHFLKANGVFIKSSCGGVGSCGDCIVKIKHPIDTYRELNQIEKKHLGNVYYMTHERLSCQLYITTNLSIEINEHDLSIIQNKQRERYMKTKIRKKSELNDATSLEKKIKRSGVKIVKGGSRRPKTFKYDNQEQEDKKNKGSK